MPDLVDLFLLEQRRVMMRVVFLKALINLSKFTVAVYKSYICLVETIQLLYFCQCVSMVSSSPINNGLF